MNEPAARQGLPEDVIAIGVGLLILLGSLALTAGFGERTTGEDGKVVSTSPLDGYLAKPGKWESNPRDAFTGTAEKPKDSWTGTTVAIVVLCMLFTCCVPLLKIAEGPATFAVGFLYVSLLAMVAYLLAGQSTIKAYNLEYALWALLVGFLVSNVFGPGALGKYGTAAVRTELYIKTGLVILGGGVLFSRLMQLGPPGVLIAWVVTPIVLITTYIFGQKILKIESPSLNMVVSADMSVCGVSAAVATAAACKATKEELSAAVGLSLTFTALMMVAMPALVTALGLDPYVGGAWIGGTVDATGAVVLAGATLGETAESVAVTVKMIQNILIGVTAFGVAAYWATREEKSADDTNSAGDANSETEATARRGLPWGEIWKRFPKFILGFVAASAIFSVIYSASADGAAIVKATTSNTKILRGWLFCLAFVCIGLELNLKLLSRQFRGGKPLILYVCGQTLNILLTLAMAAFAFKVAFRDFAGGQ